MRILFIHEVNYLNKVVYEMHEFPELLALRGHDVTFLHYPESPLVPSRALRAKTERIRGRVHENAELTLITPPTFGGRPIERYVAPLTNTPSVYRAIAQGHFDVVVLYAVPTTGWQAITVARRHGIPVVFRALDVSHRIRRTPVSALIRLAERYVYRNATVLSANNPALAEYCITASGRTGPTKVNVPPVDLSHFEREPLESYRARLGLDESHRVILYMGTFFPFAGLLTLLTTLRPSLEAHRNLRLVFVGGGAVDSELRNLSEEFGLSNQVLFTGVVSYDDLPGYLHAADVAVNPFEREMLTNVALPHKVLQYMAACTPVVSTSLDGIRELLGPDSGVTWVDGPSDVAEAATRLALASPEVRTEIAERQHATVMAKFSQAQAVDSFEATLNSVL
jgi:glycosyltransferase involved in cell wall biosynthesis